MNGVLFKTFKSRSKSFYFNENSGNTDFGDISATADTYSRVTFSYVYKHNGWRIFINLFGAFFVCGFFCIITSFFEDSGIRLQLIFAAVIGFIGNKYILYTIIPEVTQFTLSDARFKSQQL